MKRKNEHLPRAPNLIRAYSGTLNPVRTYTLITRYNTIAFEKARKQIQKIMTAEEIFNIVKDGEEYKITIGKNVASKKTFKTQELAQEYIDSRPWDLILFTIFIINNYFKEKENETEDETETNAD